MRLLHLPDNIISFKYVNPLNQIHFMKTIRPFIVTSLLITFLLFGSSCSLWNKAFGPKYGCPGNGQNVGAERILKGDKVPKARKFKA